MINTNVPREHTNYTTIPESLRVRSICAHPGEVSWIKNICKTNKATWRGTWSFYPSKNHRIWGWRTVSINRIFSKAGSLGPHKDLPLLLVPPDRAQLRFGPDLHLSLPLPLGLSQDLWNTCLPHLSAKRVLLVSTLRALGLLGWETTGPDFIISQRCPSQVSHKQDPSLPSLGLFLHLCSVKTFIQGCRVPIHHALCF